MTAQPAQSKPSSVEEFAPGCTIEWLGEGQICAMTLRTTARASFEAWAKRSSEIRQQWPADHPIFLLLDVADPQYGLTPFARSRAMEISRVRPELKTYIAIITSKSFSGQIVQIFVRSVGALFPKLNMRIFFDRQEALAWLQKELATIQQASVS